MPKLKKKATTFPFQGATSETFVHFLQVYSFERKIETISIDFVLIVHDCYKNIRTAQRKQVPIIVQP